MSNPYISLTILSETILLGDPKTLTHNGVIFDRIELSILVGCTCSGVGIIIE